LKYILLYR